MRSPIDMNNGVERRTNEWIARGHAMPEITSELQANTLQFSACPLMGTAEDYDPLMDLIGNARATQMGKQGELNTGQLVR